MENIWFLIAPLVVIFVEIVKKILVPSLIIGVLQYFICKKFYKLRYVMIIIGGIISAVCFVIGAGWAYWLTAGSGISLFNILYVIVMTVPWLIPFITPIIVMRKITKIIKKENINKMKLADL